MRKNGGGALEGIEPSCCCYNGTIERISVSLRHLSYYFAPEAAYLGVYRSNIAIYASLS